MSLRWDVLAAILGMALATYICRAGGYAVLRALPPPPFVKAMLQYLPGCIFVAFLAPGLTRMGPEAWVAAAATILAQWRFRRLPYSLLAGVATMWLLQQVLGTSPR